MRFAVSRSLLQYLVLAMFPVLTSSRLQNASVGRFKYSPQPHCNCLLVLGGCGQETTYKKSELEDRFPVKFRSKRKVYDGFVEG
jgi:hypothetical protein